jgi:hypothetical protein
MRINILLLAITFFALASCKKQSNVNENWFRVEIKSASNFDCKLPEIIFVEKQREAEQIIGSSSDVYIAEGLPKILYTAGDRLYVTIQRPVTVMACTTAGVTWPHVLITSSK